MFLVHGTHSLSWCRNKKSYPTRVVDTTEAMNQCSALSSAKGSQPGEVDYLRECLNNRRARNRRIRTKRKITRIQITHKLGTPLLPFLIARHQHSHHPGILSAAILTATVLIATAAAPAVRIKTPRANLVRRTQTAKIQLLPQSQPDRVVTLRQRELVRGEPPVVDGAPRSSSSDYRFFGTQRALAPASVSLERHGGGVRRHRLSSF
mmetsp:Transcript_7156/g.12966  ORF Transcript_7156/g.12966 Transcript_7156/m.12966 type:complete len:207 (-) Transcript_7156:65-685(-)